LPLQNIRLSVETEERGFHAMSQKTVPTSLSHCLNFKADGILQCSTQEEAYFAMVRNTVEKAMNGVSGVIVSLGPETSGKTFSLFGVRSKYEVKSCSRDHKYLHELGMR
jgi:type II secretory ATPase GspE/PulE/Tfp pilus assembly ATPase PilB-like protein